MNHLEEQLKDADSPESLARSLLGVLIRPVRTMRNVAAAKRWQWGVGLVAAFILAQFLLVVFTETDPEISRTLLLFVGVALYIPFGILFFVGITYISMVIAIRLGGTENLTGLVAARGLGYIILFFMLPLNLYFSLAGDHLTEAMSLALDGVALLIAFWAYAVEVIAIREAVRLPVGKAILTTVLVALLVLLLSQILPVPTGTPF